MSRYRNVHCLIWNDDKFPFVSDDCQLVFFHLLTTPFGTPFGMYKASISMLADEKRWPKQRYQKAFTEGLEKGFWKYDERNLVVLIPKFVKYNQPQSVNVIVSWKRIFDELPPSPLKNEWIQIVRGLLEGFREAFDKAFGKAMPIQEQEQEQYQEQEKNISRARAIPSPLPSKKISFGTFVRLTQGEYDSLLEKLGKDKLERAIAKLDQSINTGKRYKDHNLTIQHWDREGWLDKVWQQSARYGPVEKGEADMSVVRQIEEEFRKRRAENGNDRI